jgi:UrcA family protein
MSPSEAARFLILGAGPHVTIDLRSYNFERPEDVRKLYNLLKLAAESACGDSQITGSRIRTVSWRTCVEGASPRPSDEKPKPSLDM